MGGPNAPPAPSSGVVGCGAEAVALVAVRVVVRGGVWGSALGREVLTLLFFSGASGDLPLG